MHQRLLIREVLCWVDVDKLLYHCFAWSLAGVTLRQCNFVYHHFVQSLAVGCYNKSVTSVPKLRQIIKMVITGVVRYLKSLLGSKSFLYGAYERYITLSHGLSLPPLCV